MTSEGPELSWQNLTANEQKLSDGIWRSEVVLTKSDSRRNHVLLFVFSHNLHSKVQSWHFQKVQDWSFVISPWMTSHSKWMQSPSRAMHIRMMPMTSVLLFLFISSLLQAILAKKLLSGLRPTKSQRHGWNRLDCSWWLVSHPRGSRFSIMSTSCGGGAYTKKSDAGTMKNWWSFTQPMTIVMCIRLAALASG